ncbi:MAG: MATE family efflux transporter [Firmicutes bacterium]|nr:MATE family efflux transporter [Bacillota bacterium]
MKIKISDHFTYTKLLKFTFPSIIMMIFTSIYGIIDGFFVSNYVGPTQFSALNLIMPYLMLFGILGFMFGTGGSALVAAIFGAGNEKRANRIFSLLIYILIIIGAVFTIVGILIIRPVAIFLGASEQMLPYCVSYGTILMLAIIPFMLQTTFQSFFVTAERPDLGLFVTVASGVVNIVLDALLVAKFQFGLEGAASATAISQLTGGIIPLIYFALPNKSRLRLGKTKFEGRAVLQTCINGSSELMTNASLSLVNMLYNYQLMQLEGEAGVLAYGIIMYVNFIFISIFIGYSIGSCPIVSFHYGAENKNELKNLLKKSFTLIVIFSILLTLSAEFLAEPLAKIFVSYDKELLDLSKRGLMLYSISYTVTGFSIYGSAFFTALNNGMVSALISFARTLLFQIIAVLILPLILGTDGIWLSIVFAETVSLFLTVFCFAKNKKRYGYI